jgi:uncharacterized protein YhfF
MNPYHLPPGPACPAPDALDAFWRAARASLPGTAPPGPCHVRWIGLDAPSTTEILGLIRDGDKTGTFSLPWIFARTNQKPPRPGDCIVLIEYDGTPQLLVQLVEVYEVAFGAITAADTAIDGAPVRDIAVWKPLHTRYWNALLAPWGLTVTDDMPVWIERFALRYAIKGTLPFSTSGKG